MSHVSEMMLATVSNVADIYKPMIPKAFPRRQTVFHMQDGPPGARFPQRSPRIPNRGSEFNATMTHGGPRAGRAALVKRRPEVLSYQGKTPCDRQVSQISVAISGRTDHVDSARFLCRARRG